MGVDHGGLEFLMAEQFLNGPDLRAIMPIIESIFNNKSGIIRWQAPFTDYNMRAYVE